MSQPYSRLLARSSSDSLPTQTGRSTVRWLRYLRRALASLLGLGAFLLAPAVDGHRLLASEASAQSEGGEIRWVLLGVKPDEGGRVRCALYNSKGRWLNRARAYRKSSARASRRQVACIFRRVPAGTYAMAALHDADGDREMDTSLIGLPREGYAISRNEHDRMSRPDFDDAKVQFDGTQARYTARMRY